MRPVSCRRCCHVAQTLAALVTRAIGLTKRALNAAWTSDLPERLEREAWLQTASQDPVARGGAKRRI